MVTRILLDPRRDLPDGTTQSNPVVVTATPTGISEAGQVVVLPTSLSFTIATAADVFQLPASSASWKWRLVVRDAVSNTILQQRTVLVPDVASVAYAALPDVDPTSLGDTISHSRNWDATFAQLLDLIQQLTGADSFEPVGLSSDTRATLTAQITTAVGAIIGGAPDALDTLVELATAIGNDPNYAGDLATQLATKATLAQVTAAIAAQAVTDVATYVKLTAAARVTPLWSSDYDAAPSTSVDTAWATVQRPSANGTLVPASIETIQAPSVPGIGSAKPTGRVMHVSLRPYSATNPGTASPADGDVYDSSGYLANRAEVMDRYPASFGGTPIAQWPDPVGSERWYSLPIMVPVGFTFASDTKWLVWTQWKGLYGADGYSASPVVNMEIKRGNFRFGGTRTNAGLVPNDGTLGAIVPGTWTHFVVGIKFSTDPTVGWVEVWRDGVQVIARMPLATMDTHNGAGDANADPIYLKQGIYRDTAWAVQHDLYYGPVKVATTRAAASGVDVLATTAGVRMNTQPRTDIDGLVSTGSSASTINAARIQAALDTVSTSGNGMQLTIPPGTWSINPIAARSFTRLSGRNWASVLKLASGANTHMITVADGQVQQFTIDQLALDGNKANQTSGDVIHFDQNAFTPAANSTLLDDDVNHFFDRVLIRNAKGSGVWAQGPRGQSQFRSVFAYECDVNGFFIDSPDNQFDHCITANSGAEGFKVKGAQTRLAGCKSFLSGQVDAANGVGFYISGSRVAAIHVEAQDNRSNGFVLTGTNEGQLIGVAERNGLGPEPAVGGAADGIYAYGTTNWNIDLLVGDRNVGGTLMQRWAYFADTGCDNNQVRLIVGETQSGVIGSGSWGAHSLVTTTFNGVTSTPATAIARKQALIFANA